MFENATTLADDCKNASEILDLDAGLITGFTVVIAVFGVAVLFSNLIFLCALLTTESTWVSRWTSVNIALVGMIIGGVQLPLTAVKIYFNSDSWMLNPTVCLSIMAVEMFVLLELFLVNMTQTAFSYINLLNPLRGETSLLKYSSITVIVICWTFGLLLIGVSTAVIISSNEAYFRLHNLSYCSWRVYPPWFVISVVYCIIYPGYAITGVFALRLFILARRHARQIDAQERSVNIKNKNSKRSKIWKLNFCLLRSFPTIILWDATPILVGLGSNCADCMRKPWDLFLPWVLFSIAVSVNTVLKLKRHDLRKLLFNAQRRCKYSCRR